MEGHTIKLETTNEQRKLIRDFADVLPRKVEVKRYWNSHGNKVDWGTEILTDVKSMKITEHSYDCYGVHVVFWNLEINGKDAELGDIDCYEVLKTKIKLTACVGAG